MNGCREAMSVCQALWMEVLLEELKIRTEERILLMMDNKSTINLSKNIVAHGKIKQIETRFHFLRDQVCKGKLKVEFSKFETQITDILTNSLKMERFEELRSKLGVKCLGKLN